MALEHTINEEAFGKLGEAVQEHYAKDGDNYFLQANGMSPKSKVDEFRNSNIKLKESAEAQTATITDLTSKLKIANEGSSEEKVSALVETAIGKRTKTMQEDHDKTVSTLTKERDTANGSLSKMLVGDAVSREAIAAGVQDTALDDVLTRANKVFKVVDGKATPYDGEDVIYGKDGSTPLTVKDWLAGQAVSAPHLFKPSDGSGAKNENKGGGADHTTLTSTQKIAAGLKKL